MAVWAVILLTVGFSAASGIATGIAVWFVCREKSKRHVAEATVELRGDLDRAKQELEKSREDTKLSNEHLQRAQLLEAQVAKLKAEVDAGKNLNTGLQRSLHELSSTKRASIVAQVNGHMAYVRDNIEKFNLAIQNAARAYFSAVGDGPENAVWDLHGPHHVEGDVEVPKHIYSSEQEADAEAPPSSTQNKSE